VSLDYVTSFPAAILLYSVGQTDSRLTPSICAIFSNPQGEDLVFDDKRRLKKC